MIPESDVETLGSDEKLGVLFWTMQDDDCAYVQYCSHVTRFTPQWCPHHLWAFDRTCLACEEELKEWL